MWAGLFLRSLKWLAPVQEWREAKLKGVGILRQPQPHYAAIKALFGHGVLGLSKTGRPVWVMRVRCLLHAPHATHRTRRPACSAACARLRLAPHRRASAAHLAPKWIRRCIPPGSVTCGPLLLLQIGEIKKGLKAFRGSGVGDQDFERHIMFVQVVSDTLLACPLRLL